MPVKLATENKHFAPESRTAHRSSNQLEHRFALVFFRAINLIIANETGKHHIQRSSKMFERLQKLSLSHTIYD